MVSSARRWPYSSSSYHSSDDISVSALERDVQDIVLFACCSWVRALSNAFCLACCQDEHLAKASTSRPWDSFVSASRAVCWTDFEESMSAARSCVTTCVARVRCATSRGEGSSSWYLSENARDARPITRRRNQVSRSWVRHASSVVKGELRYRSIVSSQPSIATRCAQRLVLSVATTITACTPAPTPRPHSESVRGNDSSQRWETVAALSVSVASQSVGRGARCHPCVFTRCSARDRASLNRVKVAWSVTRCNITKA